MPWNGRHDVCVVEHGRIGYVGGGFYDADLLQ
jgi:hypothetical protein